MKKTFYEKVEERYRSEVENSGEYKFIRSYRKGDILPNGKIVCDSPYIQVKHLFCGSIYEIVATQFINNKVRCSKCCGSYENSLEYNYPNISRLIVCNETKDCVNTKIIYPKSGKKFYLKCSNCGGMSSKPKALNKIIDKNSYLCESCSDGVSIPEKFVMGVLKNLKISFEKEKRFAWSKNKRYDFYIPNNEIVIEVHGAQHFDGCNSFKTLGGRCFKDESDNDILKMELAIKNGIEKCNYIVIDARETKLDFLTNSVVDSLSPIFNLGSINFKDVWNESQTSLVVKTWELWEKHKNLDKVEDETKMKRTSTIKFLNRGYEIGKCSYNSKERIRLNRSVNIENRVNSRKKRIMCIQTREVFESIAEANKKYSCNIYKCLSKKHKLAGKLEDGTRLEWKILENGENTND